MTLPTKNLNQFQKQVAIIINSTAIFILAYFVGYVVNMVATTVAALYANIPVTIFKGHINFRILTHQWTNTDVITTYAAGPVACLLLGAFFFSRFNATKEQRGNWKVFFLWGYLHCFNFFLGALVSGTIIKTGFWYAVRYGVTSDGIPMVLAVVFLLTLIGLGIASGPAFLFACDSKTLMKFDNREKMLISTVFLPWLLGGLIIVGIKYPDIQLYEMLQLITLGLPLIPVYIMNQNILFSPVVRDPYKTQIEWHLLIIFGIIALIFVLLLQNGLNFN